MVTRFSRKPTALVLFVVICLADPSLARAEQDLVRYVLIDSRSNVRVDEFEVTSADVSGTSGGGQQPPAWSIRQRVLRGGRQEGVHLLTIDNGRTQIVIVPTRGLGILQVRSGRLRLGWDSPVQEVVHPQFIRLDSRRGLGWLEGFNEWLVRCGLEFAGHPGTDKFITNTGDVAEMELSLHGKIANIPASYVEVCIEREPPHRLMVRGRVEERMFFGPQLELWTEISTLPDSSELTIRDTVRNLGSGPQEFELIYHANYGPPLLEEGAQFVGPIAQVVPMNQHAAEGIDSYNHYAGPTPGWIEKVYLLKPLADPQQRTTIMLRNRDASSGVAMSYSIEQLPYLTLWKNTADEATGYVTGLEPGTSHPYNRRVERHFGRLPKLAGSEARSFEVHVRLLADAQSVRKTAEAIAAIQGDRKPQLVRQPPDITQAD